MNADQHPALITEHDDPPSPTLVLPSGLDDDQVLKLQLAVVDESTAVGSLHGPAVYMMLRAQRLPSGRMGGSRAPKAPRPGGGRWPKPVRARRGRGDAVRPG